jgi:hypothetical protein
MRIAPQLSAMRIRGRIATRAAHGGSNGPIFVIFVPIVAASSRPSW